MTGSDSPLRPRLLRNVRDLAVADVAVRVLLLITSIVASRIVGPAALGAVTVALAIVGYGSIVADAGLTVPALRALIVSPHERALIVTATTLLQLCASLLAIGLTFAIALALPVAGMTRHLVFLASPLLLIQALALSYVLQAEERMRAVAGLRIAGQVVSSGLALLLVWRTRDVAWLPLGLWIGTLVSVLVCARLLWTAGVRPSRPPRAFVLRTARTGLPFIGQSVVIQVVTSLDLIVLGTRRGDEVGYYAAANRLAFGALLLVAVVSAGIFPQLAGLWNGDAERFRRLVHVTTELAARLTLVFTAVVLIDADRITTLLFGRAFAPAGALLRILVITVPLGWLNTITAEALVAAGEQVKVLRATAIGAALFAVLLGGLVPVWGTHGAAWAAVLNAVSVALMLGRFAARLGIHPGAEFGRRWMHFVAPMAIAGATRALIPSLPMPIGAAAALGAVALLEMKSRRTTWGLLRGGVAA